MSGCELRFGRTGPIATYTLGEAGDIDDAQTKEWAALLQKELALARLGQSAQKGKDRAMADQTASVAGMSAKPSSQQPLRLRGGAAKVEITPSVDALPARYTGVNDPVFARAVVLDNGATRAALITVDAGSISNDLWSAVSRAVEGELAIPADHVILTATHTHSVPRALEAGFTERVIEAVRLAGARMVPASLAFGAGTCHINVNRNLYDSANHRWWEGPNYEGVSDKTVAVVSVSDEAGNAIAVLYNYGVHAVLTGQLDEISGDIPGASSAYIEESLGHGVAALWSEGTAGDQNPIYYQQTYDLRALRIAEYAARGIDISNDMPPGGEGLDRSDPRVSTLMGQQRRMTRSMGQLLGEEVLHTLRVGMERPLDNVTIAGGHAVVHCPGRTRTDTGRAGKPGTYVDASDVPIRLSLLRIGDIVIGGVDGEMFTDIGLRFKRESPYKHTIMATLTNGLGPSGYIASNAAGNYETFEVLSSRVKPGYAETAIVNGLLDLIADLDGDRRPVG